MPTFRTALTHIAEFDVESNEGMIRRLRDEAKKHLEAAPTNCEEIVTVCRLIFEVLRLQDRINEDRHRIAALNR